MTVRMTSTRDGNALGERQSRDRDDRKKPSMPGLDHDHPRRLRIVDHFRWRGALSAISLFSRVNRSRSVPCHRLARVGTRRELSIAFDDGIDRHQLAHQALELA